MGLIFLHCKESFRNSNKTFILDQSHTHTFVAYCFPLYEAVRVFVKVIQKVRKHTRACEMHGLGLTAHKKVLKVAVRPYRMT